MASGVTRVVLRCQAAEDSKELGELTELLQDVLHVTINVLNEHADYWGLQSVINIQGTRRDSEQQITQSTHTARRSRWLFQFMFLVFTISEGTIIYM